MNNVTKGRILAEGSSSLVIDIEQLYPNMINMACLSEQTRNTAKY
jgi:hypothetical protein